MSLRISNHPYVPACIHKNDCFALTRVLQCRYMTRNIKVLFSLFLRSQWGLSMFCCWTVESRFLKSSHDTVVLWGQCWKSSQRSPAITKIWFSPLVSGFPCLDYFLLWILFCPVLSPVTNSLHRSRLYIKILTPRLCSCTFFQSLF